MQNFTFQNATKIIFGKDTETAVGKEVRAFTNKVLLHYGGGSIKKSGLYDRVCASLKEAGVAWVELSGVQPNPRLQSGSGRNRTLPERADWLYPGRRRQQHD